MASGGLAGLVVTQVTPEVPGEKHIVAVCCGSGALKPTAEEHICIPMFSCSQFLLLHHPPLVGDWVTCCRWTAGKS